MGAVHDCPFATVDIDLSSEADDVRFFSTPVTSQALFDAMDRDLGLQLGRWTLSYLLVYAALYVGLPSIVWLIMSHDVEEPTWIEFRSQRWKYQKHLLWVLASVWIGYAIYKACSRGIGDR